MPKKPSATKKSAKTLPAAKPWEHAKSGEGSAADPLATRFVESLSFDRRLYKHDIAGSVAHAAMLESVGLITAADLKAIMRGLAEIQAEIEAAGPDYGAAWPGWRIELEDVHMCIEAALIAKIGEPGRKLHTGRSRNDQVALDLKLWIKEASAALDQRLLDLLRALLGLAKLDGTIVMPSYTHLQRAQPIVVGGELMNWLAAFQRARKRFDALRAVNDENPLGAGAIAGSSLPLDRSHTAAALGLGAPAPSSIDATASRDAAVDLAYGLSMTAMTLSRLAEQWIIYAATEFGFITLDGKYTTGSSMMPQKRNPDMLELIRGRCGWAYGELVALLTILKGLPVGYNRDLQQDKKHIFSAYDGVMDSLEMAARIVATTRFNKERIAAGLGRGFLDATALADYFVVKGGPFRTAHQVVGALVRLCESRGQHELSQLAVEDFNAACAAAGLGSTLCGKDVYDWLGPENVVRRYRTAGNAGLAGLETQIKQWTKALS
ncbi:MAG: argininosuccinate lyase [Planctomycetota bacterium]|nr:argininosuccinate lyase [Planctomycetota bacterium]